MLMVDNPGMKILRRLKVSLGFSKNILDHLKFGVFNDLEELEACFEGASVESVRKMKRIAPNLKKIGFIQCFLEDNQCLVGELGEPGIGDDLGLEQGRREGGRAGNFYRGPRLNGGPEELD
jgi:hypothetical protein